MRETGATALSYGAGLADAASIRDLRTLSQRRLPKAVFDYIDGGAEDETALRDNEDGFLGWHLVHRIAVNVAERSAKVELLGREQALPLVFSPTGLTGFYHPNGEILAARAAGRMGIPYTLSTMSVASIEEVAKGAPETDLWFQLYGLRDRDWMHGLVRRAQEAGYRVLCVTLDLPVSGRRERDVHNRFTMPLRPSLANVLDLALHPSWSLGVLRSPPRFGNFEDAGTTGFTNIAQRIAGSFDASLHWGDVQKLRDLWRGPMVIKGVMHPEDAAKAVEIGCEALMVSNHGGRQLDHSPAPVTMLPEIARAVGRRAQLIVDGGVRRGTDILKAVGLGATACSIGRPFLWGLTAGGQEGAEKAIALLRHELDVAMILLGVARLSAVTPDHLRPAQRRTRT